MLSTADRKNFNIHAFDCYQNHLHPRIAERCCSAPTSRWNMSSEIRTVPVTSAYITQVWDDSEAEGACNSLEGEEKIPVGLLPDSHDLGDICCESVQNSPRACFALLFQEENENNLPFSSTDFPIWSLLLLCVWLRHGLVMAWLTTKTSQRVGITENETCKVKRGFSSVFSCACLQTELGNGNLKQTESLPHGSPLLGFRHNQRFGFVNLSTHHSTRR